MYKEKQACMSGVLTNWTQDVYQHNLALVWHNGILFVLS